MEVNQKQIEAAEDTSLDLMKKLKRGVKMTRINRINAAKRLQSTEEFLQGINIYYSCFSVILGILSLLGDSKALSVSSIIMTVCLAISIVYLNGQKYGNRAQELQTNYIALHELLFEIEGKIASQEYGFYDELYKHYCKLLQTSENHNQIDFYQQRVEAVDQELTSLEKVVYWRIVIFKWGVRIGLIVFPPALTIWLIVVGAFTGIFF